MSEHNSTLAREREGIIMAEIVAILYVALSFYEDRRELSLRETLLRAALRVVTGALWFAYLHAYGDACAPDYALGYYTAVTFIVLTRLLRRR